MNTRDKLHMVKSSESEILANKKAGKVYVADFSNKEGKYISTVLSDGEDPHEMTLKVSGDGKEPYDIRLRISSKVEVRITYITKDDTISGVQIAKLSQGKYEKIHLSTLDFEGVLSILHIFSEVDLKSIASGSVILDKSIVGDPKELEKFLTTISTDPAGREKLKEFVKNLGIIDEGDIDKISSRKRDVQLFSRLLHNDEEFQSFKGKLGVKKDEEAWQRFFKKRSWILGSDFIRILEERIIDEDSIVDYFTESYDGHVDIVELKLPAALFWNADSTPNSELNKAIMQCLRYVSEVERRINDSKFLERLENTLVMKPLVTLIYGRSDEWGEGQKENYRILNTAYHDINVFTYDQLLERAKRIVDRENE